MSNPSLFNIKFSSKHTSHAYNYLIDYPKNSIGYRELCLIRESLKNDKLEFIERTPYISSEYVLSLSSLQVADVPSFYERGFLHCDVILREQIAFNKFLIFEYKYPNPDDLTYVREYVSMNDMLLFKEWKFQNCPNFYNEKYKFFRV